MTNTTTDNEQSFEEWLHAEFDIPPTGHHRSDMECTWDNRTTHYEALLAEKDEQIAFMGGMICSFESELGMPITGGKKDES